MELQAPRKASEADRFTAMIKGDMKMDLQSNRVSKQVMHAFQSNKFQHIRKANELKKEYYPDAGKGKGGRKEDDEESSLEVHLLQRKFEQEVRKDGGRPTSKNM